MVTSADTSASQRTSRREHLKNLYFEFKVSSVTDDYSLGNIEHPAFHVFTLYTLTDTFLL